MTSFEEIVSASDAVTAIRLTNRVIDDRPECRVDARLALRKRAEKLYGGVANNFTPRVANVWLEGGEGKEFLALLSLAATQDISYPCESNWTRRLDVAEKILERFDARTLRKCLTLLFRDTYCFLRMARNYNDFLPVLEIIHNRLPTEKDTLPPPTTSLPDKIERSLEPLSPDLQKWIELHTKEY
jgi:hypothetical protein